MKVDSTITGIIKEFASGYKIIFTGNKSYYLVDMWDNCYHLTSYSKREFLFDFIRNNDTTLNLGDKEDIINLYCLFKNITKDEFEQTYQSVFYTETK